MLHATGGTRFVRLLQSRRQAAGTILCSRLKEFVDLFQLLVSLEWPFCSSWFELQCSSPCEGLQSYSRSILLSAR